MTDERFTPASPTPEDDTIVHLSPDQQRADDQPQRWHGDSEYKAYQAWRNSPANVDTPSSDIAAIKELLKDPDTPATMSPTAKTEFVELTDEEKVGHSPSQWPGLVRAKQERLRKEREEAESQALIERALNARDKRIRVQEDSDSGISA
jgi:hypothetical protein